jgi:hypothetical protein
MSRIKKGRSLLAQCLLRYQISLSSIVNFHRKEDPKCTLIKIVLTQYLPALNFCLTKNRYRHLRSLDRKNNEYPKLTYPDIYLLEGGYSKFFESYPLRCGPYVSMYSKEHESLCEVEEREVSESWKRTEKASKYGSLSVSSRRQNSL